ncbi:MAG: hypothetical protein OEV74_14380 [Cyclobacteriaceae bacterium]|nr:hypothetical protein [Cyclobacteriaceae bacterium]MDH4297468.1 hypothetical protein [Cyclobacteriaceae bacterium]
MGWIKAKYIVFFLGVGLHYSCSVIEKSSLHGFDNGYYKHTAGKGPVEKVYLDIDAEKVIVYPVTDKKIGQPKMTLPLQQADSLYAIPSRFRKASLDIDITSVFFKYRPATDELNTQLTAELNAALYAGWRHDYYRIEGKQDPLGKNQYKIVKRGFDVGILAGPGTTFIGPSTTTTSIIKEYNGMILEYGLAAFLETNFASFGLATGFDHLLNSDRAVWIYNKKPWVGFVIGIALN